MNKHWSFTAFAFCVLATFSLFGCDQPKQQTAAQQAASTATAQPSNRIIIGHEDTFPPMEFRTPLGELVGYDIDLAQEAFKRMGNQVASHDEHFTVEDRMYLRECLRRYVPDSVEAYLRVPAAQRIVPLLNDQPCAQTALHQQLDLLLEEIRLREKKIGRSAAEKLANQQRFLASKKSR